MSAAADIAAEADDRPRRVLAPDGKRWWYYTGHPPPLRQVAGQLRTATGYTQAEGGSARALAPAWRERTAAAPAAQPHLVIPAGLNGRLLDLLHKLQAEGAWLPYAAALAADLGSGHSAAAVRLALDHLAELGLIHLWRGKSPPHLGQITLRIRGSAVELRTDRAPADMHA